MNKPERLSAASVQLQAAPLSAAARAQLEQTAAALLQHDADGTFPVADDVMSMPGSRYTCPAQFEREKSRIFRRVPLVLAASCELPQVGSYKTIEVAGIPVLLTRGRDGAVNAMLNSCTHRGAAVAQGCGVTARMTCPYHGWTFGLEGNLLGIASPADFGAVEKAALHLKRFPVAERGGLAEWTYVESRGLPGPTVSESVTIQTFLSETPPDEATRAEIARTCDFLAHVVGDEDLPTSAHQQKALATGILPEVRFGRNEGGLQHFHRWIDALVEAPDEDLPGMLAAQCR